MRFTLLFVIGVCLAALSQAKLTPTRLTCEYLLEEPLIDEMKPRLAWVNLSEPGDRGQRQTAWQIRVARTRRGLEQPDLWDSEMVLSAQSTRVVYGGAVLASRQQCWWQVRVWDKDGKVSDWSAPSRWRMGLLDASDWKAQWIGAPWQGEEAIPKPPGGPSSRTEILPPPAPLLRKEFTVGKDVTEAVAYVTGLGYFELYLNGKKVGNDVLVPNQTNYGKRPELVDAPIPVADNFKKYKVMYLAYDLTEQIRQGANVVGGILGNGFYNAPKYWTGSYGSPRFLAQIHITYADGSEEVIVSDQTWKASKSAILMDLVFDGEHYDARMEQPGWSEPDFDARHWETVALRNAPEGQLVAHTAHPDRVTERIAPVSIEKIADDRFRVDFGVEISGWLRLNEVEAPAGHKIDIKYISSDFSGDNSYTFRGEGPESYAARFNWFVFKAVEIENWPGELTPDQLTAEAVNTYVEETATFETSNPLLNDIHRIWKRSQTDNMHGGIASDCPHRERAGYTGDAQVACVTVMHNFDARSFYQKWVRDILDAQILDTGYVPNGAPWQPGCGGGPAWGAAINIMPWEFYLHYGSLDILEESYEGMKDYIGYMETWVNEDGIMNSQAGGKDGKPLKWMNLGEWAAPGDTVPSHMVHTFYFWRCVDLTVKAAEALNKKEEAEQYSILAERTRKAFHRKYFDPVSGSYGDGGGNIFALRLGVPAEHYSKVVMALRANIASNHGHLDTGIFGTQFFFEVLSENGMHDLAYAAMNKRTMPSYGHWLEEGATTTREQWNNRGSHNHPMFGGGIVWFYRKLAGMQSDPSQPGYRHIVFRPQPVDELEFTTYSNLTPYGEAGIAWRKEEESFEVDITVPVGSTASVFLPADGVQSVSESGQRADAAEGVQFQRMEDGYAVYGVESGDYRFKVNRN